MQSIFNKLKTVLNVTDKFQIEALNLFEDLISTIDTKADSSSIIQAQPILEGNFSLTRVLRADELSILGNGIILLPKLTGYKYNVTAVSVTTSSGTPFSGATNITIIQDVIPVNSGTATWYYGSVLSNANTGPQSLTKGGLQPIAASNVSIYTDAGGANAPFANPSGAGTITLSITLAYSIIKL
jgi:hypothetical protein